MKETESKYIELDDYKLWTKRIGTSGDNSEPTLIFMHDSWGCTEMWEDFPQKLMEIAGLDALIYDRRGYGKSSHFSEEERTQYYLHEEADVLIRVMDKFEINKAILYGHSDGATIALIAAATYPDRFSGIILEGAHSFVEEKGKASVRESRDKAKHNSLLQSLKKFHGNKTEELFRRWHEAWLADFFADWTIIPLLKNITCPVLAFRGEDDPYDTEEQLNVLKKEISGDVTIAIISNAAHMPRKENEDETFRWIKDFFSGSSFMYTK